MVGDINKLAESIREATIPKWLRDYVEDHRNEMVFDLKLFGVHEIPMPNGGQVVVRVSGGKTSFVELVRKTDG